ncbi:MAG: hypothetical protein R2794_01870 [Chitinophagales bacterium]
MIRRLLAVTGICIVLLSAGSGAYFLALTHARCEARKEAAHFARTGEGETLVMGAATFDALPKEKIHGGIIEIYFAGNKYDVFSVERDQSGKVKLFVSGDERETELHSDFARAQKNTHQTIPFFTFYFYQEPVLFSEMQDAAECIYITYATEFPMEPFAYLTTPPPRIFCIG